MSKPDVTMRPAAPDFDRLRECMARGWWKLD